MTTTRPRTSAKAAAPASTPAVKAATAQSAVKPAAKPGAKAVAKPAAKTTAKPASPVKSAKASAAAAKATAPAAPKADKKKVKTEKVKVVRDSFTIPKAEYTQIANLKKRALELGQEVKKSELIRAGLLLLTGCSDAALVKALGHVPTLKTGRPQKT